MGIYSASKAAIIALTQAMALELAEHGITVNAICPGAMLTDMLLASFGDDAERLGRDRDELVAEHARNIPLGRLGTSDDVGAMATFLASDAAGFTTGACINVTGGEQVFF
jgi:NAD(P)-dependent dehydrogenase (short-subunit alcohol dehydrogenase family)